VCLRTGHTIEIRDSIDFIRAPDNQTEARKRVAPYVAKHNATT